MLHRTFLTFCLFSGLACTRDGAPAPIGSFSLDTDATRDFTETSYRVEGALNASEAKALAIRLTTGMSGTVQFTADGTGSVNLETSEGITASATGNWLQSGRRIVLKGQGPNPSPFEFDWIDGSRALRLELPVGEEIAVLVFQEDSSDDG